MNSSNKPRGSSILSFSPWFWEVSSCSSRYNTKPLRSTKAKRNAFHSSLRRGIAPHETFAVKSMDVNSNLLKLKLDMVYRDLPLEEAEKRFAEVTAVVAPAPAPEVMTEVVIKAKPKRKVVKAFVPKQ